MLESVDDFLNTITMYRLVLYYLILLIVAALVLGFFGVLPYAPISLLYSTLFILIACWITNTVFAWAYNAPTNVESIYITALILVLIITPLKSLQDIQYFAFIGWASVWAMASKYILAVHKKHIFNPAAFAVALTSLTINQSASWWIGTPAMLPFVLYGGFLVVRKIRRSGLVFGYLTFAIGAIIISGLYAGHDIRTILNQSLLYSPVFFFAFVMLTEPLTTPPTKKLQITYGALTGFLFAPFVHIGSIYSTPELSLLAGNVFSYIVSPKKKLILALKAKYKVAQDTYNFVFRPDDHMKFKPGQYLEWTLGHEKPDSRGSRRYFTIASSPTEEELIMGVKFYPNASSYKTSLGLMKADDKLMVGQLAGDFVMPDDTQKKLVFIAGGIGVTPFRSMIKYLLDKGERRPITFFYSNKTYGDIAYKDIFDEAAQKIGIKTVYTLTDKNTAPADWQGQLGYIDEKMLVEQVPDYAERTFMLSGPHSMVTAFEQTLKKLGVKHSHIKTDFFPGFA